MARERPPYQPPTAERDRVWVNRVPARRRVAIKGVPAGRFLEVVQALVKEMNGRGWEAALVPDSLQEFAPRPLVWLQAGQWDDCEVCEAWLELGVQGLKAFAGGRQTFSGLQMLLPVRAGGGGDDGGLFEENSMRRWCGQQLVE